MTIEHKDKAVVFTGSNGTFTIPDSDDVGQKLCMLIEGACGDESCEEVAGLYGYSKARYFQLRAAFEAGGTASLACGKRGPKGCYRRTGEATRQIIRCRFLDPKASPDVIAQKLRQDGWPIGDRSVTRVITEYGLQKKALHMSASHHAGSEGRDASHQDNLPTRVIRRGGHRTRCPPDPGR